MATTDLRFDVTALDQASKAFARMGQAVERFERRLDDLDGKKIRAEGEFDSKKAEREVGQFARKMQRDIEAAIKSLPDIEIDTDSSDAQREIAQVRAELAAIADQRVGIDIDADEALSRVAALRGRLEALGDVDLNVQMSADVGSALAQLAAVDAAVDRLDGKTAEVKFVSDRSLSDTIIKVASLGRALGQIALPAAVIAVAPQIAGIGAAAVSASGALGLIPAAGAAAALSIGTLAVGFQNMADAFDDSPEKAAEAIAKLAPAARSAVQAIKAFGPAWNDLQLDVQGRLFDNLGSHIETLGGLYLPMLADVMGRVADSFNFSAQEVGRFLAQSSTVESVSTAFAGLENIIENVTRTFAPLTSVFVDVLAVGATVLEEITRGAGDATQAFADFVSTARETGQLAAWMREGVDTVAQLGRILGDVGGILLDVFGAADAAGVSFLSTVERITQGIRDFTGSAEGQQAIVALFTGIREVVDAVAPGIERLATAVANVISRLQDAGVFRLAGEALSALAEAAAPVIEDLGELAAVVLPPLLTLVRELAPVLVPAAAGFLAISTAAKGLTALTGVSTMLLGVGRGAKDAGDKSKDADGKVGALRGKLILLGGAATVAFAGLSQLSDIELDLPEPDASGWERYRAQAESNLKQVGQMFDSILAGDFQRFASQWSTFWSGPGSTITLTVEEQEAWASAEALIRKINDSDARVTVDGDTVPLGAAVQRVMDAIATGRSTVTIDGETMPAQEALNAIRERINAEEGQISINGTTVPAGDALFQILAQINAASGTLLINGDETPVSESLAAVQAAIDAGEGFVTINGDKIPAEQALALLTSTINTSSAVVNIDGETTPAADALAQVEALIDNGGGIVNIDGNFMPAETALDLIKGRIDATTGRVNVDANTAPGEAKYGRMVDGINQNEANIPIGATDRVQPTLASIVAAVNNASGMVNIDGNTVPAGTALQQVVAAISAGQGTVTINGNQLPAAQAFEAVQALIDTGVGTVTINGDSVPAGFALRSLITAINTGNGTVIINGNRVPADAVLNALVSTMNSSTGTATLTANAGPADGVRDSWLARTNASSATSTMNANSAPANAVLDGWLGRTNAARATATADANAGPANAAVDSWRSRTNSTTGTVRADANTSAANSAIDHAARTRYATIEVRYRQVGIIPGLGGAVGGAAGGIVKAMRDGGVLGMADGGGVALTPMRGGIAQVVAPNTWRVIGDRVRDDEAFIPINRSHRSRSILDETADRMGYEIVPRKALTLAPGGMIRAEDGSYVPPSFYSKVSPAYAAANGVPRGGSVAGGSSLGSLGISVRRMHDGGMIRGTGLGGWVQQTVRSAVRSPRGRGGSPQLATLGADIRAAVRAAVAEAVAHARQTTINNHFDVALSELSGRVAQVQRTQSAMGMF